MCMCFRKIKSKQKAARKGGFVRMLKDQEKEVSYLYQKKYAKFVSAVLGPDVDL